jgi:hypothetical protein
MKRAIVAVATTLILTAGQAMAERVSPPRQVNGLSLIPWCYCTCLDSCCPKCPEDEFERADGRLSARPKQLERTTNRYSTSIPGATPYLSPWQGGAADRQVHQ